MLTYSTVGVVVPGNTVNPAKREDAGVLSSGGGSEVKEAGRSAPQMLDVRLLVKLDKLYRVVEDLGPGELNRKPSFGGATDGAGKMGVSGPTLGILQATPPGYTVTGTAVVLLVPRLIMLEVMRMDVRPVNEL